MLKKQTIKDLAERRKRVIKARLKNQKRSIQNIDGHNKDDCVYLIQHGNSPVYKIGYGNPVKRLKQMQTGNPVYLSIIESIHLGSACLSVEKILHDRYHEYKINGEWFYFSDIIDIVRNDFQLIQLGCIFEFSQVPRLNTKELQHIACWISTNLGYKSLQEVNLQEQENGSVNQ